MHRSRSRVHTGKDSLLNEVVMICLCLPHQACCSSVVSDSQYHAVSPVCRAAHRLTLALPIPVTDQQHITHLSTSAHPVSLLLVLS